MSFLDTLIPIFTHYKYLLIFPVAVIEGPIISIISGFLVSIGQLNFYLAFFTVMLGDFVGDTLYYLIGKYGRESFIHKYGHHIGLTMPRIERIERHFDKHATKTLFLGKFAHGLGSLTWIAAGMSQVSYKKFLSMNVTTTAIKSYTLVLIGFYYGRAYQGINQYLQIFSTIGIVVFIVLYILAIKTDIIKRLMGFGDVEQD